MSADPVPVRLYGPSDLLPLGGLNTRMYHVPKVGEIITVDNHEQRVPLVVTQVSTVVCVHCPSTPCVPHVVVERQR